MDYTRARGPSVGPLAALLGREVQYRGWTQQKQEITDTMVISLCNMLVQKYEICYRFSSQGIRGSVSRLLFTLSTLRLAAINRQGLVTDIDLNNRVQWIRGLIY